MVLRIYNSKFTNFHEFYQDNLIAKKVVKIWKSEFEIGETVLCAVHMIVIILIPKN